MKNLCTPSLDNFYKRGFRVSLLILVDNAAKSGTRASLFRCSRSSNKRT